MQDGCESHEAKVLASGVLGGTLLSPKASGKQAGCMLHGSFDKRREVQTLRHDTA